MRGSLLGVFAVVLAGCASGPLTTATSDACADLFNAANRVQAQFNASHPCQADSECAITRSESDFPDDCADCGFVVNTSYLHDEQSQLSAACKPFYFLGCELGRHSCPAEHPFCDAGSCSLR